jgi:sporulation protein YhbH
VSIFRNHKTSADRSASDRSRHKEKIKRAIKDGVYNIVSSESIIGKDGKKKIKIPVRGIKEYRFIYGKNEKKVGSAPGKNISKGQIIGDGKKKRKAKSDKGAGNQRGEEFYEVEITLQELSDYLFDNLKLPDLEKKKFKKLISDGFKRKGFRKKGIRPRLSKKETLKNKLKRKKAASRDNPDFDDENFSFHESDLKYKHIDYKSRENSNAIIFFMMDVSGSMSKAKRFKARSFFFLLYHFLRSKYENVEIVFISHTIEAKEVSEDNFFKESTTGGTIISSALEKCLDIVDKRYHTDSWNIYAFHCSDGDNWPTDNDKAVKLSLKLSQICQLYCYIQIAAAANETFWSTGGMAGVYEKIKSSKFKIISIEKSEDVWREFKRIFRQGE